MNPDSTSSAVTWELTGDPCHTQERAFAGIKNDMEAFIICNRGDGFLQATCGGPESYHCEISFAKGKGSDLYSAPKDLTYSQLDDLFSRYAEGEDLSYLKHEWDLHVEPPVERITKILIPALVILIVAGLMIYRSMN